MNMSSSAASCEAATTTTAAVASDIEKIHDIHKEENEEGPDKENEDEDENTAAAESGALRGALRGVKTAGRTAGRTAAKAKIGALPRIDSKVVARHANRLSNATDLGIALKGVQSDYKQVANGGTGTGAGSAEKGGKRQPLPHHHQQQQKQKQQQQHHKDDMNTKTSSAHFTSSTNISSNKSVRLVNAILSAVPAFVKSTIQGAALFSAFEVTLQALIHETHRAHDANEVSSSGSGSGSSSSSADKNSPSAVAEVVTDVYPYSQDQNYPSYLNAAAHTAIHATAGMCMCIYAYVKYLGELILNK